MYPVAPAITLVFVADICIENDDTWRRSDVPTIRAWITRIILLNWFFPTTTKQNPSNEVSKFTWLGSTVFANWYLAVDLYEASNEEVVECSVCRPADEMVETWVEVEKVWLVIRFCAAVVCRNCGITRYFRLSFSALKFDRITNEKLNKLLHTKGIPEYQKPPPWPRWSQIWNIGIEK